MGAQQHYSDDDNTSSPGNIDSIIVWIISAIILLVFVPLFVFGIRDYQNRPKFHVNSVSVSSFKVSPFNPHVVSGNWTVTLQVNTQDSDTYKLFWKTSEPFVRYHDGSPVVSWYNDPKSDNHIDAKVELVTFVMACDSYQAPLRDRTAYSLILDLADNGGAAKFTFGVKGGLEKNTIGIIRGRFSVTCEKVEVQFLGNATSGGGASGSLMGEPKRCKFSEDF